MKKIILISALSIMCACIIGCGDKQLTAVVVDKVMGNVQSSFFGDDGRWTVVLKAENGKVYSGKNKEMYYGAEIGDVLSIVYRVDNATFEMNDVESWQIIHD